MLELCSLSLNDLKNWLKENGEPSFRAKQIFEWVYKHNAPDFNAMTNLSKKLRGLLLEHCRYPSLTLAQVIDSGDAETFKYLWKLNDGSFVESVLICSGQRRTVCVSTQVGCRVRCAFCASGKGGFVRNLSTSEIVEQVVHINYSLKSKGEVVSHVVFMGMGEPMENLDNVIPAITLLTDPCGCGISQRRITVSTVGVVEGIDKFADAGFKVNLALSLHAPNQPLRRRLIPYARKYSLGDVLEAVDRYYQKTKRDITYEYILIDGVNDSLEHARELASLVGRHTTVNLIPCNPVVGSSFKRPSSEKVKNFAAILEDKGINTTWRYTKGDDIAAACGQLALACDESK